MNSLVDEERIEKAPIVEGLPHVPPGYAVEFGTGRLIPMNQATVAADSAPVTKRPRKRGG